MIEAPVPAININTILTVVEATIHHGQVSEESVGSQDIRDAVRDAINEVHAFCNRNFITDLNSVRTYSAVAGNILPIEEIVVTGMTPVVRVSGSILSVNNYQLMLNEARTAYDRLKRLVGGLAVAWDSSISGQPEDAVTVTADHAYATSIPSRVKRAYIVNATLMAYNRGLLYTGSGGSDVGSLYVGPEAETLWQNLVRGYIRRRAMQVVVVRE